MSYSAQDLFGDLSDNDGFSEDENFSTEGSKLFKKLSSEPCKINTNNYDTFKSTNNSKDTWKSKNSNVSTKNNSKNETVVRELFSGINLINPLVSSEELRMLMNGRKMIKLSQLKSHINKNTSDIDDDWVTIGVVVSKGSKTSKNGNQYSLWKLSDLKADKFVSLFLFGKTNDKHWKLPLGAVIGLLNASIMSDNKDYKGKAAEMCSITLDDPDKLLHIGTSKDMGYCKALKKSGDVCGNLISKSEEEYCLYHIKNAYRKFSSKRAELQTTFSNKEPEDYYFGNNFTPNVTLNQKNIVLEMKNVNRNQLASKKKKEDQSLQKVIANPISLAAQNLAVLSTSNKGDTKTHSSGTSSPASFNDFFTKMKERKVNNAPPPVNTTGQKPLPALAKGHKRGQSINLVIRTSDSEMSAAKRRAIEIFKNRPTALSIHKNGTNLSASNSAPPAPVDKGKSKKLQDILKRVNQNMNDSNQELAQEQLEEQKARSELIQAALKRKSISADIAKAVENEAEEKHFKMLEKKEIYENKLVSTSELKVKVVSCSICKYTEMSQSDLCKAEQHPAKFHTAIKRFFSCKDCKTHTFTYDLFRPAKLCKMCGSSNFEKAGMIKTKTETKLGKNLLIRGEEINFLNSIK